MTPKRDPKSTLERSKIDVNIDAFSRQHEQVAQPKTDAPTGIRKSSLPAKISPLGETLPGLPGAVPGTHVRVCAF